MSFREEQMGKYFMSNRSNLEVPTIADAAERLKQEKAEEEIKKALFEAERNKQAEINKKLETLELIPIGNKIILLPYPKNPYRKVVSGQIIVDFDGSFLNPDSGESDKLKELVGCAKVIEVGPEVKWTKEGDDVYYDTRTVYPMPFMSLGYVETSEPSLLAIMNEGLKERLKK